MDAPLDLVRPLIRTRQYRQFTGEPVSEDNLRALTEVARWSGSSRNSQPWRFIVVRDEPIIRGLWQAGIPQTRSLETAMAVIAIAMPQQQGADSSWEGRALSYAYDEGRVAERILIAATLLDIGAGIAWLRPDVRSRAAELLGLPDDRFVRTLMALGHPSPEARAPMSAPGEARLPAGEVVEWR
ncbi:nitroreductase [soil metagenome]